MLSINFKNFKSPKQIAACLIITKFNDCDVVKRLQQVQYAAARFVVFRYVRDVEELI